MMREPRGAKPTAASRAWRPVVSSARHIRLLYTDGRKISAGDFLRLPIERQGFERCGDFWPQQVSGLGLRVWRLMLLLLSDDFRRLPHNLSAIYGLVQRATDSRASGSYETSS